SATSPSDSAVADSKLIPSRCPPGQGLQPQRVSDVGFATPARMAERSTAACAQGIYIDSPMLRRSVFLTLLLLLVLAAPASAAITRGWAPGPSPKQVRALAG